MKRYFTATLLLSCVLSACTPVPTVTPARYTLETSAAQVAAGPRAPAPRFTQTLRIARLGAPAWLDSTNLYYRLAYAEAAQISPYARARWIGTPPALLERFLQQRLAATGLWRAVIGANDDARADLTLRLRLVEFEQVFTAPNVSHATVVLQATLVDERLARVIAQRDFRSRVRAPSADAIGGIAALRRASVRLSASLVRWLSRVTPVAAG